MSGTLGGIHLQGVLATCTFVECSNKQDARICLLESVFISYFALFRTNCEWAALRGCFVSDVVSVGLGL